MPSRSRPSSARDRNAVGRVARWPPVAPRAVNGIGPLPKIERTRRPSRPPSGRRTGARRALRTAGMCVQARPRRPSLPFHPQLRLLGVEPQERELLEAGLEPELAERRGDRLGRPGRRLGAALPDPISSASVVRSSPRTRVTLAAAEAARVEGLQPGTIPAVQEVGDDRRAIQSPPRARSSGRRSSRGSLLPGCRRPLRESGRSGPPRRDRDRRLPHRRRAVPDRHRRRRRRLRGDRSSPGGATRSSASTTCGSCSSTSREATPTCTAATSSSPNDDGADLGVVFFHNAGYSTACGHGTIALVTWALESGVRRAPEGETRVVVDVPSGRLETWATVVDGRVASVRFRNVPAFVWATGVRAAGSRGRRRLRRRVLRVVPRAGRAAGAAAPDRARAGPETGARGRARDRPSARARAPGRLRRGLLAAGAGRRLDPAERHRVRRRRGRPLALRLGNVRAARAPRRRR